MDAAAARLAALPPLRPRPVSPRGHAAVLVALFPIASTPHVLLTRRPAKLSSHGGEVCLPGGKRDDGDADDDAATAVREAFEEVGLDSARVQVLCTRPSLLSKHLLSVTPVVAEVAVADGGGVDGREEGLAALLGLTLNPAEVETCFAVPLSVFVDGPPATPLPTLASCSYSYSDARFGPGQTAPPFRLHYFDVVPTPGCGGLPDGSPFTVWGLTAGVLIEVAAAALGRAPVFQVGPDAAPGLGFDEIEVGRDGRPTVRARGGAGEEDGEAAAA